MNEAGIMAVANKIPKVISLKKKKIAGESVAAECDKRKRFILQFTENE